MIALYTFINTVHQPGATDAAMNKSAPVPALRELTVYWVREQPGPDQGWGSGSDILAEILGGIGRRVV